MHNPEDALDSCTWGSSSYQSGGQLISCLRWKNHQQVIASFQKLIGHNQLVYVKDARGGRGQFLKRQEPHLVANDNFKT